LLKNNGAHRRHEKDFVPSTISPLNRSFHNEEPVPSAKELLDAWHHRRLAIVASFEPAILRGAKTAGTAARQAKGVFQPYKLTNFEITAAVLDQPCAAEIQAVVEVNGERRNIRFRMVRWGVYGNVALPGDHGAAWGLAVWAPRTFFKE
jgi:hypothetical protein